MNLVGKYFLQDFSDQHYRTGKIVGVLPAFGMFLAKLDDVMLDERHFIMPMFVFDVSELIDRLEDGWAVWSLFNTRQELNTYLDNISNHDKKQTGTVIQLRR